MIIDTYLLLGIIGMILILIGFVFNQLGRWKQEMFVYDLCNLVGGIFLVVYAYAGKAWPFFILNGVWALYSLKDVIYDIKNSHVR